MSGLISYTHSSVIYLTLVQRPLSHYRGTVSNQQKTVHLHERIKFLFIRK